MSTFRDNILSLFVKFDTTSQTLAEKSLDNILLRVAFGIYTEKGDKPFTNKEVKNRLDPLMGGNIDIKRIDESIKKQNRRFSPCGNNRYTLSKQAYNELKEAEEKSVNTHKHIIDKYFKGASTSEELLVDWFKKVLSEFFVSHFAEYTQDLHFRKRTEEYQNDIETIITRSFESSGIEKGKEQAFLRKCFRHFFEDRDDTKNNLLFWNYGVTCFAARMAGSTMFADQFTVQALKDTTFVLDTNVLFTINLEDSFEKGTIIRLEDTLKLLKASLVYLQPTKEEYQSVANGSYSYLMGHANKLQDIEFSTQINDAAIRFGCFDKESLDRFFDAHINTLPTLLHDSLPITIEESKELKDFLKKKENLRDVDQKYRALLKERQSSKKEIPIVHDVAILSYVYYLRRQQKKFTILTNDSSLQEYATRNPIWDEGAIAISLDTLIAILSINYAGISGVGYEALFKELVKLNFKPLEGDLREPDLYIINEILTKIEEIDSEKGEELQREVLRLRSENAPFNNIHLLLVRELKLQERNQSKELNEYKSINADQQRRIDELTPALDFLKSDIKTKRKRWRIALCVMGVCFAIGGIFGLICSIWHACMTTNNWTIFEILKFIGIIFSSLAGIVSPFFKISDRIKLLALDDESLENAAKEKIRKHNNKIKYKTS